MRYILDPSGNPVSEPDLMAWARWMEKNERHVALTQIGGARISTVFLGMDHNFFDEGPPVLWETMVFGGKYDDEQERYTSLEAAKRGHNEWVGKVARDNLPRVPYEKMCRI